VQVLFSTMLVGAAHTALEDGEIALDGVGVDITTDVLFSGMLDALVSGEGLADFSVEAAFVGVERAFNSDVLSDQFRNIDLGSLLNVKGTDGTATLDKANNNALVIGARFTLEKRSAFALWRQALIGSLPQVGFVSLYGLAFATKRAKATFAHRFADTVSHEPCSLEGNAKGAVQLVGTDALL